MFEEIGPGRFALFAGKVKDPRANDGRAAYAGDASFLDVAATPFVAPFTDAKL